MGANGLNSDVATGALDLLESRPIQTLYGRCHEHLYRYQNSDILALRFDAGDEASEDVPVRIHSTCFSAHYCGSVECDCREQLDMTLAAMAKEGRGVVVFLEQDGRGNGHAALMRSAVLAARADVTVGEAYERLGYPRDARDYTGAALVIQALGVRSARLLTNNPDKIECLRRVGIGVTIVETAVDATAGPWLQNYYVRKAEEGHFITVPTAEGGSDA